MNSTSAKNKVASLEGTEGSLEKDNMVRITWLSGSSRYRDAGTSITLAIFKVVLVQTIPPPDLRAQHCEYATLLAGRF